MLAIFLVSLFVLTNDEVVMMGMILEQLVEKMLRRI